MVAAAYGHVSWEERATSTRIHLPITAPRDLKDINGDICFDATKANFPRLTLRFLQKVLNPDVCIVEPGFHSMARSTKDSLRVSTRLM